MSHAALQSQVQHFNSATFFVLELDIASQAWKSSKINAELLYMTADFER